MQRRMHARCGKPTPAVIGVLIIPGRTSKTAIPALASRSAKSLVMIGSVDLKRQYSARSSDAIVRLFNKRLDDSDRIVLGDDVIQAFWKRCHLLAIFTLYKSLHPVTNAE
jgi:hypothetical protein